MKSFALLFPLTLMTACATVTYVPPEGATNNQPLTLSVSNGPRLLTLGSASLQLVKPVDEHSELPYLEDGGTYTTCTGGEYLFHAAYGDQIKVILTKDSEIDVVPGGQFATTLSTLSVQVFNPQGTPGTALVKKAVGSDSYLVLKADTQIVVTMDFHGVSQGKATSAWNQPTAFIFTKAGETEGYLSLGQDPVFYGSQGRDAQPAPDVALAVLVAYESARGSFDSAPMTLPERLD